MICTTHRWIPASASTNQGSKKGSLIAVKEEEVADAVAEIEALRALVADHDDVQALVVQLHQAHSVAHMDVAARARVLHAARHDASALLALFTPANSVEEVRPCEKPI